MSQKTINAMNKVLVKSDNGDIHVKRKTLRSMLGIVLGVLIIVVSLWIITSVFSGKWDNVLFALVLLVFGGFLLNYGLKEMGAPEIVIRKASQKVILQPHWPSKAKEQSWPFSQFLGILYHHMYTITTSGQEAKTYGISLVLQDGKMLPVTEIAPGKRQKVIELLKDTMGLPELQPSNEQVGAKPG